MCGLSKSLKQPLQHVGMHQPAKRQLWGCFEGRKRFLAVALHVCTCCYFDYPQFVAKWIVHNTKSHPHHNSGCLTNMSFDNVLQKAALTGIASNTNEVIIFLKLKHSSSEKTTLCQSDALLCVHEPTADVVVDGLPCGVSCVMASLHAVHGAKVVDELTMPTLVHLQLQTKVLSTAWGKLYSHSRPIGADDDRRVLTSSSVAHSQFLLLIGARQFTAFKLESPWNCSTAHELQLRYRKILILEGR